MTNVDHHAFVIFAKSQQYVERYTEIKISGSSLRIPAGISQNHASIGWLYYIVFECASYHGTPTFLLRSISTPLSSHQISSNMNATQLFPNVTWGLCQFGPLCQFFFDVQKAFVRCVQILLLWVFLFHRCTRTLCWRTDCTCESQSWCDRRKSARLQYLGYQSSQMLRTANPKDLKNVTFDMLNFFFFFCLMQLDERVLSNCDVTDLVKNALSLCIRSVLFSTSISRSRYHYRMCNLTVISSPRKSSNRPFWSTMILLDP